MMILASIDPAMNTGPTDLAEQLLGALEQHGYAPPQLRLHDGPLSRTMGETAFNAHTEGKSLTLTAAMQPLGRATDRLLDSGR
jgi:hypothetical protein